MKKLKTIFMVMLLLPLVLAQGAQVKIQHYGYGETPQKAKFTVHSIGGTPISNITIYVDGEVYKQVNTYLTPNKGISTTINLEPGTHTIEVETSEGAYDSMELQISTETQEINPAPEEKTFVQTNNFKLVLALGVIAVVVIWLLMKKQNLEF
jgi:hypothetical protein